MGDFQSSKQTPEGYPGKPCTQPSNQTGLQAVGQKGRQASQFPGITACVEADGSCCSSYEA